jgi:hypothetical protein
VETGQFLNEVKAPQVHKAIPELQELFARYGLNDLYAMYICRAEPRPRPSPHADAKPVEEQDEPKRAVAVNWPIFNCSNTFTVFYEPRTDIEIKDNGRMLGNRLQYFEYGLDQVIETHRIKIEVPTAIRYDRVHAIINETDEIRWTASFRFLSNHWELFKD